MVDIGSQLFEQYIQLFSDAPGWFDRGSSALWDCLLTAQEQYLVKSFPQWMDGGRGHLLEIGVWKGKSAGLLALHCRSDERCVFTDALSLDEAKERISKAAPSAVCHYRQCWSQRLLQEDILKKSTSTFRWIHVDGEHSHEIVTLDMRTADRLLTRGGLLVVDDFFSYEYPQVTQAVFDFLHAYPGCFSLVMCAFNKAYLCRPTAVRSYTFYVEKYLISEMKKRIEEDLTVFKTSMLSDHGCFGLSYRTQGFEYRGPDWIPNHDFLRES